MNRGRDAAAGRHAVLAAIARREWLLRLLALGAAAGCQRADDRAYARGNTLIVALSDSFDRPLCPDYPGESLVFLPLVRTNEKGDRQPCLATDWEHSADYREWTYRLRPNVRWHDGRPVTIDDVTFTLELHSRPDSPYFGFLTESVTVHDSSTFTVRGVNWSGYAGQEQDAWVSILPKHLVQDLDHRKISQSRSSFPIAAPTSSTGASKGSTHPGGPIGCWSRRTCGWRIDASGDRPHR